MNEEYETQVVEEDDLQLAPRPNFDTVDYKWNDLIGKAKTLSPSRERAVIIQARDGSKPDQSILLVNYFPLVFKFARKYFRLNSQYDLQDLLQVGREALIAAIKHFDLSRPGSLGKFARKRVRGAIIEYVSNEGAPLPIPKDKHKMFKLLDDTISELKQKLSREPSEEDIASATGWSREYVREMSLFQQRKNIHSLAAPLADEEGTFSYEPQADPSCQPEEDFEKSERKELLEKILAECDNLTENEKIAVKYRFGLGGVAEETFEQLGTRLHLSWQGAQKTLARGLKKMGETPTAKKYKEQNRPNPRQAIRNKSQPAGPDGFSMLAVTIVVTSTVSR